MDGWQRGGPGLTQGRRTENHDIPRLISRLAVRVGNPCHNYHPEGFWTGARSPGGLRGCGGGGRWRAERARWWREVEG